MTVQATFGSVRIRMSGRATPAYNRTFFHAEDSVFSTTATPALKPVSAMGPFEAIHHNFRVTNYPSIVREEDSPLTSSAASTSGERYHGPHGRLLVFKSR
jgi:hypothetical protein